MRSDATRPRESTIPPVVVPTLYLAFELGGKTWKLAITTGPGQAPRLRTVPARDLTRVADELTRAKARFHLDPDAPVVSCYEAGRDGFWLHRALMAQGIENVVIDPSSIAVDRRLRRAKTDRLDAGRLVVQLMNAAAGDRRGWREVRVPSVAAEADRHLQREWETVLEDRKRIRNRIHGLLATHGVRVALTDSFRRAVTTVCTWAHVPLPAALIERLDREWTQLQHVEARLTALRRARRARVQQGDPVAAAVEQLTTLRGIGVNGALTLVTELFAWRHFTNGRQIGGIVGLTPTPYQSDQTGVEQGISRSGNRRVRALSIELAWAWLRHQPRSALSRWFAERFGHHPRARRIGIVAVARKLLIAFWRYLDQGVLPEGALLKA